MTDATLGTILSELRQILSHSGLSDRADWLGERQRVLEDIASSTEERAKARAELHEIINGMGGLNDLWPDPGADSSLSRSDLHDSIRRLADQLWELTRD
jgi:hypothetical protein